MINKSINTMINIWRKVQNYLVSWGGGCTFSGLKWLVCEMKWCNALVVHHSDGNQHRRSTIQLLLIPDCVYGHGQMSLWCTWPRIYIGNNYKITLLWRLSDRYGLCCSLSIIVSDLYCWEDWNLLACDLQLVNVAFWAHFDPSCSKQQNSDLSWSMWDEEHIYEPVW